MTIVGSAAKQAGAAHAPGHGPDLLATIVAATERIVEVRQRRTPRAKVERRALAREARGEAFRTALARPDRLNVIAECKRRSPSKGVLRRDYDPVAIARDYAAAGAAAISVLTEPTFFDGALAHLEGVRARVDVPLLRKDFTICEYQLLEARAAGADAVLLIVGALDDRRLADLLARASGLGLASLVEVHDVDELRRAVDAGAEIIGVNNRDLRTLQVDVGASTALIGQMPRGIVAVAESGLRSRDDLDGLRRAGFRAFLVGERLVTQPRPAVALAELLGTEPHAGGGGSA